MREIKSNSSGWIHREYRNRSNFAWQIGYGAFTVSASQKKALVYAHVECQERHHSGRSFKSKYIAVLKAHEVEYDEKHTRD